MTANTAIPLSCPTPSGKFSWKRESYCSPEALQGSTGLQQKVPASHLSKGTWRRPGQESLGTSSFQGLEGVEAGCPWWGYEEMRNDHCQPKDLASQSLEKWRKQMEGRNLLQRPVSCPGNGSVSSRKTCTSSDFRVSMIKMQDVRQSYWDEHHTVHTNTESSGCSVETDKC